MGGESADMHCKNMWNLPSSFLGCLYLCWFYSGKLLIRALVLFWQFSRNQNILSLILSQIFWWIAARMKMKEYKSNKWFLSPYIGWRVTKDGCVSFEVGANEQGDQCQSFSLGHNFCYRPLDCCQISQKWLLWIIQKMAMSPRRGVYNFKWLFICKETSAKSSVEVTILWI